MFSKLRSLFLVALFVSVGSLSCSACSSKTTSPALPPVVPSAEIPVVPPVVVTTVTITRDNCEFTLPTADWIELPKSSSMNLALVNQEKHNLIVLINEPFSGSAPDYAIMAIQGVRSAGATISSVKSVDINGRSFVLVSAVKENIMLYSWVTTVNGQGYGFSCGGSGEQLETCSNIMKTFKIK